jgi:hypothetical protein
MDPDDRKTTGQKGKEARQAVSDRLRRFYGTLLSGLEADADEFLRRVMEEQNREHGSTVSQP